MYAKKQILVFFLLALLSGIHAVAGVIRGTVKSKDDGQPLEGAVIQVAGIGTPCVSEAGGAFEIGNLKRGTYTLTVSYITYATKTLSVTLKDSARVEVLLESKNVSLKGATVRARARRNTETAIVAQQQKSLVQQSGVSEQQIKRTQDKDASEVIRRIPGISIIDEKFVMVRGLSQRYNNVWLNSAAVPSSEADSRAFSFDLIPSSQLDNIQIVKSPAAEYPADFTGGFILINTKDVPTQNTQSVSVGLNVNDRTDFSSFKYAKGSGTDFLGFDGGLRSMDGGINRTMNLLPNGGVDLKKNGLNNDWRVHRFTPLADFSLSANLTRCYNLESGHTIALLGALNYSNGYKTYRNMKNSLFGAYDVTNNRSNYLRHSVDDQYNHNVRLGAMLNLTFLPKNRNSQYELKNLFNQLATDRYTYRKGVNAQSNNEESAEYYYNSRTTYSGQFIGKHRLGGSKNLDWGMGYSYANRRLPDRRRYVLDDGLDAGNVSLSNANDITREFTQLDEHIMSGKANYQQVLQLGKFKPQIRTGIYGEYRTRKYFTREFIYNWNAADNDLPSGFRYMDLPTQLLRDENYGERGLYMIEKVKWSNNYEGKNSLAAGYVGANMPFGRLDVYAGVRYEYNRMELISHTRDHERSPHSTFYTDNDLFPSVNMKYRLDNKDKHQLRLSYGRTINRPEFREVSPSVYYDFDLSSNVQGNYQLKSCYVDNFDLRYEFYPSKSEQVSLAVFYKKFDRPIEWTYTVNGGTDLTYSYTNARGADNYGVELDVKKNLAFLGLKNFSWNFNGSLIKSKVRFPSGSKDKDRPMQGQSPYLVNTGIFYSNDKKGWDVAVLYNRIGKRIVGVGRNLGSQENQVRIPDSYEMPRNTIDISATKKLGRHWELKASVRDLLAERVQYKQFEKTSKGEIEEIPRQYNPGRNILLNATYKF